jgi:hypothetical protein
MRFATSTKDPRTIHASCLVTLDVVRRICGTDIVSSRLANTRREDHVCLDTRTEQPPAHALLNRVVVAVEHVACVPPRHAVVNAPSLPLRG